MWKLEYDPILSVDLLMLDSVASLLHCLAVPPVKRFFFVESFMLLHFQITIKEWSLVVSTQGFSHRRGQCKFV